MRRPLLLALVKILALVQPQTMLVQELLLMTRPQQHLAVLCFRLDKKRLQRVDTILSA